MRHDGTYRALHFYRRLRPGRLIVVRAGVVDYFGWNVIFIRTLAIVALFWLNVPMLIAYFVFRISYLGFTLPTKPVTLHD